VRLLDSLEPLQDEDPQFRGTFKHAFFLYQLDIGQGRSAGHRVAPVARGRAYALHPVLDSVTVDCRRDRESITESLAQSHDVRHDIIMIDIEYLAGSSHAGEYFVHEEQDAEFIAQLADSRQPLVRRHDSSPPPLNRLHHDRRDLVCGQLCDRLADEIHTVDSAFRIGQIVAAAIAAGERNPERTRGPRPADSGHGGEALGAERLAVHVVVERDELVFPGGGAGGVQACLDALRPFAPELYVVQVSGRDLNQRLQESRLDFGVEIMAVLKLARVLDPCLCDLGMAMAEVCDIDAAAEVYVRVAVHIGKRDAFAGFVGHLKEPRLGRIALHVLAGSLLDGV